MIFRWTPGLRLLGWQERLQLLPPGFGQAGQAQHANGTRVGRGRKWRLTSPADLMAAFGHSPNGVILTKRYDVPYNCALILIRLLPLPKVPVGSCLHPVLTLCFVLRLPLLKDAEEEGDEQVPLGIHGEDEIPLRERPLGSDTSH